MFSFDIIIKIFVDYLDGILYPLPMTSNQFAQLDAQSPVDRFAQFTPEEHSEYQAYLDAQTCARDAAGDPTPDDVNGSHGWPGDGSGEDDLADLMAVGDEGCCDGPECAEDDCHGVDCDIPEYPE